MMSGFEITSMILTSYQTQPVELPGGRGWLIPPSPTRAGRPLLVRTHGHGGGGGCGGNNTGFWANQWQTTHFSKIADCSEVNSFNDIVCPAPPVAE